MVVHGKFSNTPCELVPWGSVHGGTVLYPELATGMATGTAHLSVVLSNGFASTMETEKLLVMCGHIITAVKILVGEYIPSTSE